MKSSAAQKLKELRERTGLTVREVARLIGKPASSYASYEDKYKKPYLPITLVKDLEPHFRAKGIEPRELYALAGVDRGATLAASSAKEPVPYFSKPGIVEVDGTEFASIPRYDAALSAGFGSIIDPNAEPIGHHLIEAQWLHAITRTAPNHMAVIRVAGDSMEDTLSDGDWVLLDRTQNRVSHEGVYALQIDDTTWVKRLTLNLRERLIRVVSDNPRYPVQDLPPDELTVIGRVICIVARKV
jgi:phage repressor protein C with HTH and peptisase S24 domain/DNA-binding XRE family transcriptional regulator